jgi:hypothetical protein
MIFNHSIAVLKCDSVPMREHIFFFINEAAEHHQLTNSDPRLSTVACDIQA